MGEVETNGISGQDSIDSNFRSEPIQTEFPVEIEVDDIFGQESRRR